MWKTDGEDRATIIGVFLFYVNFRLFATGKLAIFSILPGVELGFLPRLYDLYPGFLYNPGVCRYNENRKTMHQEANVMSFTVFTDGFSNLPGSALNGRGISILPSTYYVDGKPVEYDGDVDRFDAHGYYDSLRAGTEVRTSLVNAQAFQDAFLPALQRGEDIVYVGLSSAVSGTYQAAVMPPRPCPSSFPSGRSARWIPRAPGWAPGS